MVEDEDTVELIDYLRVIWKRKGLIIAGTLICMVTAGAVSFLLPPVHKVYSVVEIGATQVYSMVPEREKRVNLSNLSRFL